VTSDLRLPAATVFAVAVAMLGAPSGAGAQSASAGRAPLRPPSVSAREAIVVDADTGQVLYARNARRRAPIASTTKLMTALLTLERAQLGQIFRVVYYPATDVESTAGLRAGERMSVRDLLRAMLLPSANEAAQTLAVRVAGSERAFVQAMNAQAQALGLRDTRYATPVGLDVPGNYSTASDLVRLATVDMANPFFARTVDMASAHLTTGARPRTVINRNDLVGLYSYVDGIKTGHTSQAGYVLVGAAHRGGVHLISAVLGDPTLSARDSDTLALLRYGLGRYHRVTVVKAGAALASVPVRFAGGRVELVPGSAVTRDLPLGDRPRVSLRSLPARLKGPLAAGTREGTATVSDRGRTIAEVALVTQRALPKPTLGQRLRDYATRTLTLVLLAGLLACSLLLAILQHRVTRRRRRRGLARQEQIRQRG
jgi:D-alanyl-D-alanine carboxypeptidase (penicillin-binding protein 5/6)